MLVEIDLLDYLAYQMGCGILSDLRLFQQSERLHRLTAAIPLGACSEQEWLDAAQYLTGHDCASALEQEPSGEIACKKQTLPPRGGSTYHVNRVPGS